MEQIGIVGLGYVGLPLASAFANADHQVVGYDIDQQKVDKLRSKHTVTPGATPSDHDERVPEYTSNPDRLQNCNVIITAVPTPLTDSSKPDLSNVRAAGRTIGEQLRPGMTVVLESTVYPGATREEFVPEIERASGLSLDDDFAVGYSPERIVPGHHHDLHNSVKPVSGHTVAARSELMALYETVVDELYPAPSIESAEAAKCLENVQRDLNIALINEFAMACDGIDWLDYDEVLSVADSKWNFTRYSPGLVEGHCLPVDPYFLIERLEQFGASASLMREARAVNESVVDFIGGLVDDALSERDERTEGTSNRFLVCGLAYKPNADDLRSNAKRRLFDDLRDRGLEPVGYDPHVDSADATAAFDLEMWSSIDEGEATGVLMLTNHDEFSALSLDDIAEAYSDLPAVVDASRVFDEPAAADVIYRRF